MTRAGLNILDESGGLRPLLERTLHAAAARGAEMAKG
jgi:pyrroline-5-carboxylate reductase